MRITTISIFLALLSVPITSAEEAWRFVVLADWHWAEKYTQSQNPSDEFAAAAARDVASVSFLKKNFGGDLVLLPGDSNEGHWKRDTILKLGRLCYGGMIDSFNKGGYTNLLVAVGDHELGDNPWPVNSEKAKSQELFRQAFAQAFNQTPDGAFKFSTPIGSASSRPVGTKYEKTSYAYQHKNVLFVTVDVFRIEDPGKQLGGQGSVSGSVEGKHLEWLDAVLGEGRKQPGIKHIVVQSHLPVIHPVRKVQSSGMLMDNDVDSDFWKTIRKHKVDVYFAGEVHANTVTKDPGSDLVQVVSRGNGFSNFLAVDVMDEDIKITCYGKGGEEKANPYTTIGQLTLEKRQGGTTVKGEGELALLDSSRVLMHFDFEERFQKVKRIGEIQCTEAFANNGVFGKLFDAHFTKVGTVDGPKGKAGNFDAESCMAVFGMGPHYPERPVSYALWIKTTSAEPMVLINSGSIWGKGTQNFMNLNLVGGQPEVQISKEQRLIANAVLNDGKWHHVAVSVANSGAKLSETTIYVDGKQVECRLQGKDEVLKTNQAVCLSFGCFGYSRPEFGKMGIKPYTGALDEIKVWARGLSENDIKSLIELEPIQIGKEPKESEFIYGADISALSEIEAKGSVFRENGTPADAIHLTTKHGVNTYRLRLFVNPTMKEVVVQDLPYALKLAKRIKAAGGKFLLDLHYSDTWADPAHQYKPKAWESLSFKELEAAVESYSSDVITAFKKEGCLPDMVQVGNEINPGFLWPTGKINAEKGGWERFADLLKAGIRGVRAPLAKDDDVKIMIHIATGGSWSQTKWFFSGIEKHGVSFDVIGLSYYPEWHGGIDQLKDNLAQTAAAFKKPIVVVETAYPWAPYEKSEMKNMNWPQTPEGQREFLREVTATVKATPDNLGIGVFWWYPEAIPTKGLQIWNGGRTALFDKNGEVLPALRDWRTPTKPNE